jgi:hypothetical protein
MLHSKKGQGVKLSLDALTQLAVALIAVIALGTAFWASTRGNSFEKGILATDQALIIDTLYSGQGNTFFAYPSIPFTSLFDFFEDSINVYEKGDMIKLSHNYLPDASILSKQTVELEINNTEQLQFLKSDSEIAIGKDLVYNPFMEECPETKQLVRKITIRPKIIDGEANQLAENLREILKNIGNIEEIRIDDAITKDFDILIEITKNPKEDSMEINIPFNSPRSKRLSCLIANNLMQRMQLNIPIIPSDKQLFQELDELVPYRAMISISVGENFSSITNLFIMKSAFEEYMK